MVQRQNVEWSISHKEREKPNVRKSNFHVPLLICLTNLVLQNAKRETSWKWENNCKLLFDNFYLLQIFFIPVFAKLNHLMWRVPNQSSWCSCLTRRIPLEQQLVQSCVLIQPQHHLQPQLQVAYYSTLCS